jgi:glutamate transport system substrate-binding protein
MATKTERRRWAPVLLVALLSVALVSCGSDKKATTSGSGSATTTTAKPTFAAGTTMARLQDKKTMTVGTKFDQPLFGLKDPRTGDVQGFDVEIAKLIAKALGGVDVKFVETPSAIRETAIIDGTVDMVVATYTINDTRKQRVDFAGPYYVAGQDIMVKKGDKSITGVEALGGKTVCSVQGSTSIENVRKMAPAAKLVEYQLYSQCAEDLKNGRVDAVSTDNVILLGLIEASGDIFELVGKPFTREPYGIGVKKGDAAFRTFVNDTLDTIYKNGDWAKAYQATIGKVSKQTPTPPPVDRY